MQWVPWLHHSSLKPELHVKQFPWPFSKWKTVFHSETFCTVKSSGRGGICSRENGKTEVESCDHYCPGAWNEVENCFPQLKPNSQMGHSRVPLAHFHLSLSLTYQNLCHPTHATCPMASALSCRVASLCSIRTSLPVPRGRRRTKLFQFHSCLCTRSKISSSAHSFSWDDALRVSLAEYSQDDSSNLSGFFDRIKLCNRGSVAIIKTILGFVSCLILDIVSRPANSVSVFLQELQSEFLPLVVEAEIVGYIHNG